MGVASMPSSSLNQVRALARANRKLHIPLVGRRIGIQQLCNAVIMVRLDGPPVSRAGRVGRLRAKLISVGQRKGSGFWQNWSFQAAQEPWTLNERNRTEKAIVPKSPTAPGIPLWVESRHWTLPLPDRLQPKQPTTAAVFEQIDLAARALSDFADAVAHVPLVGLARLVAADADVDQRLAR